MAPAHHAEHAAYHIAYHTFDGGGEEKRKFKRVVNLDHGVSNSQENESIQHGDDTKQENRRTCADDTPAVTADTACSTANVTAHDATNATGGRAADTITASTISSAAHTANNATSCH